MRNDWRASLVPAAAVIPAPRAYIRVVAVKTCVAEAEVRRRRAFRQGGLAVASALFARVLLMTCWFVRPAYGSSLCIWGWRRAIYLEQMRALEVGESSA